MPLLGYLIDVCPVVERLKTMMSRRDEARRPASGHDVPSSHDVKRVKMMTEKKNIRLHFGDL